MKIRPVGVLLFRADRQTDMTNLSAILRTHPRKSNNSPVRHLAIILSNSSLLCFL